MRLELWVFAAVAAVGLAVHAREACAASVLAAQLEGFNVSAGSALKGRFDLTFTGNVGSNMGSVAGTFLVTGGSMAANFGGVGALAPMTGSLSNFHSTVTGTNGINTQPAFGGNIFAEAATYANQPHVWGGGTQFITFDYGTLRIDGLGGAYALVGGGSTMPTMGKIYRYNGSTYVNFWLNRVQIITPAGTWTKSSGDWIAGVTTSSLSPEPPIPEPSSVAVGALMALGLGGWAWRRRRGSASRVAA